MLMNEPQRVAVCADSQRGHVMYVGRCGGTVSMLEYTYKPVYTLIA
jgi:hypothetical protein